MTVSKPRGSPKIKRHPVAPIEAKSMPPDVGSAGADQTTRRNCPLFTERFCFLNFGRGLRFARYQPARFGRPISNLSTLPMTILRVNTILYFAVNPAAVSLAVRLSSSHIRRKSSIASSVQKNLVAVISPPRRAVRRLRLADREP